MDINFNLQIAQDILDRGNTGKLTTLLLQDVNFQTQSIFNDSFSMGLIGSNITDPIKRTHMEPLYGPPPSQDLISYVDPMLNIIPNKINKEFIFQPLVNLVPKTMQDFKKNNEDFIFEELDFYTGPDSMFDNIKNYVNTKYDSSEITNYFGKQYKTHGGKISTESESQTTTKNVTFDVYDEMISCPDNKNNSLSFSMIDMEDVCRDPTKSIDLFSDILRNVEEVSVKADESFENMEELSDKVEELSDKVDESFENTEELSENTEELSENTEELSENTEELSENTEELSENTEELSEKVDESFENTEKLSENTEKVCHIPDQKMSLCDELADKMMELDSFKFSNGYTCEKSYLEYVSVCVLYLAYNDQEKYSDFINVARMTFLKWLRTVYIKLVGEWKMVFDELVLCKYINFINTLKTDMEEFKFFILRVIYQKSGNIFPCLFGLFYQDKIVGDSFIFSDLGIDTAGSTQNIIEHINTKYNITVQSKYLKNIKLFNTFVFLSWVYVNTLTKITDNIWVESELSRFRQKFKSIPDNYIPDVYFLKDLDQPNLLKLQEENKKINNTIINLRYG
ncbi:hypothetical protein AL387_gp135 [Salmon gill poxvirus]|uniref:Uncharacterized protein n=1 Tax=Salmon gill poxvirus TaxID=1680908 RepID=A0A0H4YFN0_9POXV|nr:hypothetical protein AL387_gp135 [Salmon gill poxvirus]AKR04259.1 hypothetical protein SGPV135 [Salmon gill poxvirus]